MRYTIISTFDIALRNQPYATASKTGFVLLAGQTGSGDALQIYTTSGDGFLAGDKWVQLTTPSLGWVPVIRNGQVISTLTDSGVTPPPASNQIEYLIVESYDAAGNILTQHQSDGTATTRLRLNKA